MVAVALAVAVAHSLPWYGGGCGDDGASVGCYICKCYWLLQLVEVARAVVTTSTDASITHTERGGGKESECVRAGRYVCVCICSAASFILVGPS